MIPDGITVTYAHGKLTVAAGKASSEKVLKSPLVTMEVKDGNIILQSKRYTKREKCMLNTYIAHINNMMKGVKEKYVYKMKICSGHFPMNVSVSGKDFIVKNFIGEKTPRVLKMQDGVDVKVEGDVVTVESHDKEIGGQTAGDIEQLTRRTSFDRRIYQEGIYIFEKPGKKLV